MLILCRYKIYQLWEKTSVQLRCHAVSFHKTLRFTHTDSNTHLHTHRDTHRRAALLSASLQLTASLGVVFLSSHLAEMTQDAISLNLLNIFLLFPLQPTQPSSTRSSPGQELHVSGAHPARSPPLHVCPPPVVRARSIRQPVRFGRRAAPQRSPRSSVWSSAVFSPLALQQEKPFMATHNVRRGPI